MSISADKYCSIDGSGLVTGEISDVTNTPFDFRQPKLINQDIALDNTQLRLANGYDHPFMLNSKPQLNNETGDSRYSETPSSESTQKIMLKNNDGLYPKTHIPDAKLVDQLNQKLMEFMHQNSVYFFNQY